MGGRVGATSNGSAQSTGRVVEEKPYEESFVIRDPSEFDDDLATLMPAHTKRFEAYLSSMSGVAVEKSNVAGEQGMAGGHEIGQNDKENRMFVRGSTRELKRRRGTGRVSTIAPINYEKLLEMGTRMASSPSSSLFKNVTTVLKDKNVNQKMGSFSTIVDDFRSTEHERKISVIARRKLSGANSPAKNLPQKPVEPRQERYERSRRDGTRRSLSRLSTGKPVRFDLELDTANVLEWDKEQLIVEHEMPSPLMSFRDGRLSALEGNKSLNRDLDRTGSAAAHAELNVAAERRSNVAAAQEGGKSTNLPAAFQEGESPGALSDMDLSQGQWPPEQDAVTKSTVDHRYGATLDANHQESELIMDRNTQKPWELDPSPTPPANPLSAYLASLKNWEASTGKRRLDFLSPSSISTSPQEPSKENALGAEQVQSPNEVWDGGNVRMTHPQDTLQVDEITTREERNHSSPGGIQQVAQQLTVEDTGRDSGGPDPSTCRPLDHGLSGHQCPIVENVRESPARDLNRSRPLDNDQSGQQYLGVDNLRESAGRNDHSPPADSCQSGQRPNVDENKENSRNSLPLERDNREQSLRSRGALDPPHGGNAPPSKSQDVPGGREQVRERDNEAGRLREEPVATSRTKPAHSQSLRPAEKNKGVDNATFVPHQAARQTEIAEENDAAQQGLILEDASSITTKAKPKPKHKRLNKVAKEPARRSSLEYAGSLWKDGQRRSQRHRVRPLAWWRGEKLLYGRVHKDVTSLIGIKSMSPETYARGIREFRVESLVSKEHDDLVRFMAL